MTAPSAQIEPRSLGFHTVFSHHFFEIPPNQREYKWGNRELEEFWEDLWRCVEDDVIADPSAPLGHFMGTIVVVGDSVSDPENRLKIIDGQQRLTSVMILAATLADFIGEYTDNSHRFRQLDRQVSDYLTDANFQKPRLYLNHQNTFFLKSIVEAGNLAERRNYWDANSETVAAKPVCKAIVYAFEYFKGQVQKKIDGRLQQGGEAIDVLSPIIMALNNYFYALFVRAEDNRMAYRFFETLNDPARGQDLTQADLIRNALLERAEAQGSGSFDKTAANWRDIVEEIEDQQEIKISVPQLVQFSYSSRYAKVRAEETFDKISEDLKRNVYSPDSLSAEFARDAATWSEFVQGNLGFWDEETIDRRYAIIDPLWKKHAVPYLLAVAERFNGPGKIRDLNRALRLLECYLFRQGFIGGDGLEQLQNVFSEAGQKVRQGASLDDIRDFFAYHSPVGPYLDSFSVATVSNMKQAFYVAWSIENYIQRNEAGSGLDFRPAKQSPRQHLEHIMPRKPSPEWGGIENTEEFGNYLNRLGNHLVLEAEINRKVRNKALDKKMREPNSKSYSDSELALPQEFIARAKEWCEGGEWTFESIKRRQSYLALEYGECVWALL